VDFLFSGTFSRQSFDEIRRAQGLKFNMEQAPKNIVAFVQGLRQDSKNRFVSCALVEEGGPKGKNICR